MHWPTHRNFNLISIFSTTWWFTLMLGHFSLSLRATPVMVPPVPAPATSMSTLPDGTMSVKKKSKHDILGLRLYNAVSHTITLLQDLLSRGVIVSQRVARVTVLVQNVRVWDLIFKAPSHTNVRLWWVEASAGWCAHNLSSKCSQYIHLYLQNTEETWKKSPQRKKINSNMVHLWSKTAGDNYHDHGKKISKICSLVSRRRTAFLFLPYQDS